MTNKELLYIEDALGHEKFFASRCREAGEQLQDGSLRELAAQLEQRHGRIFSDFYSLLNG